MMRTALMILVATALLYAGCANPEQVRKHTYPPSFRYITQGEIRGTMSTLACAYCHTPPAGTPQPPSPIPGESVRD